MRDRLADIWPFFGIRLRTPSLELALPLEADLVTLADVASKTTIKVFSRPVPSGRTYSTRKNTDEPESTRSKRTCVKTISMSSQ